MDRYVWYFERETVHFPEDGDPYSSWDPYDPPEGPFTGTMEEVNSYMEYLSLTYGGLYNATSEGDPFRKKN